MSHDDMTAALRRFAQDRLRLANREEIESKSAQTWAAKALHKGMALAYEQDADAIERLVAKYVGREAVGL